MPAFKQVGLISSHENRMIADSLARVSQFLEYNRITTVTDEHTLSLMDTSQLPCLSHLEMGQACDLVITVGGDGNILGAARTFAPHGVPILGVNRGHLGFLADISPESIESGIGEVLAGNYSVEEHFLLEGQIVSGERVGDVSVALNEIVIHPRLLQRMLQFDLFVNDSFVYNQHSDGLIISSPTGSTAYSLSAGGPIMHPDLDAIVLVPMFPHTLNSRPLMVHGGSEIRVVLDPESRLQTHVSFDSQGEIDALPGDQLLVRKYQTPLKLVHPPGHSFYEVCRSKLDWASRLGTRPVD